MMVALHIILGFIALAAVLTFCVALFLIWGAVSLVDSFEDTSDQRANGNGPPLPHGILSRDRMRAERVRKAFLAPVHAARLSSEE